MADMKVIIGACAAVAAVVIILVVVLLLLRRRKSAKVLDVEAGAGGAVRASQVELAAQEAVTKWRAQMNGANPLRDLPQDVYPLCLLEDIAAGVSLGLSKEQTAEFYWAFRRHGGETVIKTRLVLGFDLYDVYRQSKRDRSGCVKWGDLSLAHLGVSQEDADAMASVSAVCGSDAVAFADLFDMVEARAAFKACGMKDGRVPVSKAKPAFDSIAKRSQDHEPLLGLYADGLLFGDYVWLLAAVRAWNGSADFAGGTLPAQFLAQFLAQAGLSDDDSTAAAAALKAALPQCTSVSLRAFYGLSVLARMADAARAAGGFSDAQAAHLRPLGLDSRDAGAPDLAGLLRMHSSVLG